MAQEGLVTLKEALAFIDMLDTAELSDSTSTTANDIAPSSSQTTKKPKPRATKRKRSNLSSSTRLQQRNKAELLYLRKYAQELEEKRAKLETWDKGISQAEADTAGNSVWMNLAKTHFQARLRSETTHRTLKTILTSQAQVIDLLHDIIHKQTFGLEMDLTSVVKASANVSFPTEIDNTNALKGVSVVCSEYFDTDMPLM
ncbi:hypothetical protein DVH05_007498 [Phytophthora capsici]|nr:hypothetical protein DVH05_007498 [Phytophthora capsici]